MRTRSKLALITLCAGVTVGAVGVTQSWFVSLNRTPPGSILSAVVHYLPETQIEQSTTDILTYGNLVSGTGVDEEGIPHVLPGESLLATVLEAGAGTNYKRTVYTSRVRDYQRLETVRTTIQSEIRSYQVTTEVEDEEGNLVPHTETLQVTRFQRNLFHESQTIAVDGTLLPDGEQPDLTGWELVSMTTRRKEPVTADGKTVTVVTTTSSYVLTADRTQKKTVVTTVTETVTHEAEQYAGGTQADFSGSTTWISTMTETVLALLPNETNPQYTRTQLTVVGPGKNLPLGSGHLLPLSVGNVSTVDTNLRVGVSATVTPPPVEGVQQPARALEVRASGNSYYLGMKSGEQFVELLELKLATGWKATTDANLWDFALPDGSLRIPAQADPLADPTLYQAVTDVAICTQSHFGLEGGQDAFELLFNELYAKNNPIIELRVRFYAKQADYMDWAEFHTTGLTLNVAGGTTESGGGGGAL